jgi:hypothetical protein
MKHIMHIRKTGLGKQQVHVYIFVSRLNRKIFDFGTFLDVEGAYDNASFDLMAAGCHEHLSTKWIGSLFGNRTAHPKKYRPG